MKYPSIQERAAALVTAAVHHATTETDDARAVLDRMLGGELSEEGLVDPMMLRVVLMMHASSIRALAAVIDKDPEVLWQQVAVAYLNEQGTD